jgi:hypothetical protein
MCMVRGQKAGPVSRPSRPKQLAHVAGAEQRQDDL